MKKDIKSLTAFFIRKYGTNNPFEIARSLDIEVYQIPLGEISGYYKYQKKHKCIFLNSELENIHFMRLVMAHELGHAILHPKENCYFLEHHTLMLTNKNEVEANRFAVNLLISDDELSNYKEYSCEQISNITGYEMKLIELRMKDYRG